MANIIYHRNGTGDGRIANSNPEVSLERINDHYSSVAVKFFEDIPEFTRDGKEPTVAVSLTNAVRVFVYVESNETEGKFSKEGFWLLEGVNPEDFHEKVINAANTV